MGSTDCERADYPCVIDVRAFIESVRGRPASGKRDDFLTARHLVDLPRGPTQVGTIELGQSTGQVADMPWNEFVLVVEGSLHIGGAVDFILRKGESGVLPRNASFTWTAAEPVLLAFIRQESAASNARLPVKIDPTLPRKPSPPPPQELLIGEMPAPCRHIDFESDDGLFIAACWDSSAYARHAFTYEFFELMYLLDGSVSLVDRAGRQHSFRKDDIVVVRKGGEASWVSDEWVGKVAAVCRA